MTLVEAVQFERIVPLHPEIEGDELDLPPFLRQTVKTQNPMNGELSHGFVTQAIHEGIQAGRGSAAGSRGIAWPRLHGGWRSIRTCCNVGGVSFVRRPATRFPGNVAAALVRRPRSRVGAQNRSAGSGDRFFEGVLAAHRGTADAAGTDWQSAVFRKIGEEVKANRGLTVERMVKLARAV